MAFKAKDLHYEKQEPAFLKRLRAGNTSDRSPISISRPRKARLDTGEDEGPTIVDERGETVTVGEFERLAGDKDSGEKYPDGQGDGVVRDVTGEMDWKTPPTALGKNGQEAKAGEPKGGEEENREGRGSSDKNVTTGPKKRKQAKIIDADPEPDTESLSASSTKAERGGAKVKAKTKRAKVKLCFDDGGE